MLIGYARTSAAHQIAGLEGQARDLMAAGVEKLFQEQVSSMAAHRPQLAAALDYARAGDVVTVTRPDRLARSTTDLLSIVSKLDKKGVGLVILSMGGQRIDTRDATAKLLLTMLAAVAEFELSLQRERQMEGVRKAQREGRYKGRAPTAMAKASEVKKLHAEGVRPVDIAKRLGIARASVYRALAA